MEFNRHHEFKLELVSETLSIQSVHYIQTNIENYHEMMTTEKKKIPLWSRRMHNGLRAYHELLMTLAMMDKSEDDSVRGSSLALKSKLFYIVEYRELPLILLQNYDEVKMSKGYLKDLVEMTHVFLRLLEGMCKKTRHLMVQQPKKKRVIKKKRSQTVKEPTTPLTPEQLEQQWTASADDLSAAVQGTAGDLPSVLPYDPLSDLPEDKQKEQAMRKINALLRKKELLEAVSLLRASRELWPEGDIFGVQDIDSAEEFGCLREIFMADLNPVEEANKEASEDEEEQDEEDELQQEMEESSAHISERELDFPSFVRRFSHTKVLQAYSLLLRNYQTNSSHVNRCIIKLFHRIAWDSKMPAIFFQSSLFVTLHQTMTDPARKSSDVIAEIVKFAKYIVRQFFKVAETNPKVFMEILFWKNIKEAVDIECGYDAPISTKAMKSVWSEEEDDELIRLYEEFKDRQFDPDDEKDVADLIFQNLIRQDRTKRMVIKKLKDLALIENVKQLKNKPTVTSGRKWTETEEMELKVLFEEHKLAMDPLGRIIEFMIQPKSKNRVVNKLLELGVIKDKSEVKKKRVPKPKQAKSKGTGQNFISANNESDNEDGNESSASSGGNGSSDDSDEERLAPRAPRSSAPSVVTPHIVASGLSKVRADGNMEGVRWLIEILTEVADDREQDGEFEDIPMLAINEEQTTAIENTNFQTLMKVIGLQAPQTEQEMFWRVPSKLTIEGLRKRVLYLTQGLEGTLQGSPQQELSSPTNEEMDVESLPSPKLKTKPRKNKSNNKKVDLSEIVSSLSNDDSVSIIPQSVARSEPLSSHNTTRPSGKRHFSDDFDTLLDSTKKTTKKRRVVINDSDDDEENLPPIDYEETQDMDTSTGDASKARIVESDDESVTVNNTSINNNSDSDDDTLLPIRAKSHMLAESDDEELPSMRPKAKANVIDSDDE